MDKGKSDIINRFILNIKGKKCDLKNDNSKHCGKEGYWLEKKMNISNNSNIEHYEVMF